MCVITHVHELERQEIAGLRSRLLPGQAILKDGEHMLGELSPHLTWPEACLWLSVTNLATVGYGSIVSSLQLTSAVPKSLCEG